MSTPNEEIERIVEGLLRECSDRSLFDIDAFDRAIAKEIRNMFRTTLTTYATAVREEERERIGKIREKIQALDTFDSGEFGSGYLNAQSDAIMILDEALTPLPTKDSI